MFFEVKEDQSVSGNILISALHHVGLVRSSDCSWTRTQNHLVLKNTGQFGQMVECSFKN